MRREIKYPKIPLAQSVITICKQNEVKHIVISPGSRNAPLTLGFTSDDFFSCYSIVDERCAAFFAMGIAQQLQVPVALVCTSGSALLNYYPAIAEAFYSRYPLIILSADRPLNKIDIGDGQTIRQQNVFANHILKSVNLEENASKENDLNTQYAIYLSKKLKGPVHINVPFEEPLYEMVNELSVTVDEVKFNEEGFETMWSEDTDEQWNESKKILILVGELRPDSLSNKVIDFLSSDPSVLVLVEKTSNLNHESFISRIDTLITSFDEVNISSFNPDLLITFGGMVVSKRIKSLLRKNHNMTHWHIDPYRAYDTYGFLKKHFTITPESFFSKIIEKKKLKDFSYKNKWLEVYQEKIEKSSLYLSSIPFCDLKVFETLTGKIKGKVNLQVSNSSAIRYLQLFDLDSRIKVFCNRGTSGIDGSTSTAIGSSVANGEKTILITGDISFFYDSNALWNNYVPKNFKIIILNNGGGGIFRILPGHEENKTFNTFFETSHKLSAQHLANMFGFAYQKASTLSELEGQINDFLSVDDFPKILEVFTPEKINNKILLDYFKNIK